MKIQLNKAIFFVLILSTLLFAFHLSPNASNTEHKQVIVGRWMNPEESLSIKIQHVKDNEFAGYVDWKNHKADEAFKVKQKVIRKLTYQKPNHYSKGESWIQNIGWVNCSAKLIDKNTLSFTGTKMGISRTRIFKRVK